jgi:hypothetical protein
MEPVGYFFWYLSLISFYNFQTRRRAMQKLFFTELNHEYA